jgi:excinuclease UvrABC nuclease subunit
MRRLLLALLLAATALPWAAHAADNQGPDHEYLYYRDLNVPPFQSLREFFDLPNHPGNYEVTLVSEAVGPLTFKVMRVRGEHEVTLKQYRSYHIHDHEFHLTFDNSDGQADLMVGIANSNPATSAKVTVIVVQLP